MAKGLQFSSLSVKELSEKKTKEISPVDLKKPYPGQLSVAGHYPAEKLKGIPIIREDQWITAGPTPFFLVNTVFA